MKPYTQDYLKILFIKNDTIVKLDQKTQEKVDELIIKLMEQIFTPITFLNTKIKQLSYKQNCPLLALDKNGKPLFENDTTYLKEMFYKELNVVLDSLIEKLRKSDSVGD